VPKVRHRRVLVELYESVHDRDDERLHGARNIEESPDARKGAEAV
jgi:hypothetical protein